MQRARRELIHSELGNVVLVNRPEPIPRRQQSSAPSRIMFDLDCPLTSAVHDEAKSIQAQSVHWALAVGLVGPHDAARLDAQRIGWLAARCFPRGSRNGVEIVANWLTFHCLVDDIVEEADPIGLAKVLAAIREGLALAPNRSPTRAQHPIAAAAADLRRQFLSALTDAQYEVFAGGAERLVASFEHEAQFRGKVALFSIEHLMNFREVNVGVEPLLLLIEPIHGVKLLDADHRTVDLGPLARAVCRIGALANDVMTFADERCNGRAVNAVAFVTEMENCDWHEARRQVVELHNREMARFLAATNVLMSLGASHDNSITRYVETLRFFVRGHLDWALQSDRHRLHASTHGICS